MIKAHWAPSKHTQEKPDEALDDDDVFDDDARLLSDVQLTKELPSVAQQAAMDQKQTAAGPPQVMCCHHLPCVFHIRCISGRPSLSPALCPGNSAVSKGKGRCPWHMSEVGLGSTAR